MARALDALESPRYPTPRDAAQRMIEIGIDLRTIRDLLRRAAGATDEPAELNAILRRLTGRHVRRHAPSR